MLGQYFFEELLVDYLESGLMARELALYKHDFSVSPLAERLDVFIVIYRSFVNHLI